MAMALVRPSLLQQLRGALATCGALDATGSRSLSDAASSARRAVPADGRTLADFVRQGSGDRREPAHSAAAEASAAAATAADAGQPGLPDQAGLPQRTAFVETYGW